MDHPTIVKGVSDRSLLSCIIALIVVGGNAFFDWQKGFFLSSKFGIFGSFVLLVLAACIFLGYKRYIHLVVIFLLNGLFITYSFLEGLITGAYLYFFPLILVMTFILIDNYKHKIEIFFAFFCTIISFCVCIFWVNYESVYQNIPKHIANKTFTINATTSIILCAVFAYIALVYDIKMKRILLCQRNTANEHAEKVRQQNMQLKDITFITAHSVRAPLSNILGLVHLLQNKEFNEDEKQKIIGFLNDASKSLDEVLRDVIDKSKQVDETPL